MLKRGEEEEPNVSFVSFPFPLYCSYFLGRKWRWFGKGVRDVVGALEGKVSASRIVRIDLRMLSWIAARQTILPRKRRWAYTVVEILQGGDKLSYLRKDAEGMNVVESLISLDAYSHKY